MNFIYSCILLIIFIVILHFIWKPSKVKPHIIEESKDTVEVLKKPVKPVFGVKIVPFASSESVVIKFTNDDFVTEQTLNKILDYSPVSGEIDVKTIPYIFRNLEDAKSFAERFCNYDQCIAWNKKEEAKVQPLIGHYKLVPPISAIRNYKVKKLLGEGEEIIIKCDK